MVVRRGMGQCVIVWFGIFFYVLGTCVLYYFGNFGSVYFRDGSAVFCRVLQCVAVCCSILQGVAVCCSVLQCVAGCCSVLQCNAVCGRVLQCVAVCCTSQTVQCHVSFKLCITMTHSAMSQVQGGVES